MKPLQSIRVPRDQPFVSPTAGGRKPPGPGQVDDQSGHLRASGQCLGLVYGRQAFLQHL